MAGTDDSPAGRLRGVSPAVDASVAGIRGALVCELVSAALSSAVPATAPELLCSIARRLVLCALAPEDASPTTGDTRPERSESWALLALRFEC